MTYGHIGAATHRKRSKQCAQVHSVHCFVTDPSFYNIPHSHYTGSLSLKYNEIGLKWKEITLYAVNIMSVPEIIERSQEHKSTVKYRTFVLLPVL
jgi:hypothetical protein